MQTHHQLRKQIKIKGCFPMSVSVIEFSTRSFRVTQRQIAERKDEKMGGNLHWYEDRRRLKTDNFAFQRLGKEPTEAAPYKLHFFKSAYQPLIFILEVSGFDWDDSRSDIFNADVSLCLAEASGRWMAAFNDCYFFLSDIRHQLFG